MGQAYEDWLSVFYLFMARESDKVPTVSGNLLTFSILAAIAVISSLGVVFSKSAVRSALFLVVDFFVLAGLYFTLNAEMLGITQIVVYAGAIMVLFLFVVMLLNFVNPDELVQKVDRRLILASLFAFGLVGIIGSQLLLPLSSYLSPRAPNDFGGPHPIGMALFTTYGYPFEAISLLLMVGIVGSILLAKRRIH